MRFDEPNRKSNENAQKLTGNWEIPGKGFSFGQSVISVM